MSDSRERRFLGEPVQHRAGDDGEGRTISGLAAMVNTRTNLGWFDEEIAPGAFDNVLNDDVRCLGNHDSNIIFGRTTAGTLQLELDKNGHLAYRCTMPNTTLGNDWLESIKRGDISQSSFGFTIVGEEWHEREGETPLRVITEVGRLFDVSPVTFPAYTQTDVAARSHAEAVKKNLNATVGAVRTFINHQNLKNKR